MRLVLFLTVLFGGMVVLSIATISATNNPEDLIVGSWKEQSWQYEKIGSDSQDKLLLNDQHQSEIYKNLVIHKAETWEFDKYGQLILSTPHQNREILHWTIKGRGNILELEHRSGKKEDYQIELLTKDSLVLYFYFDLQIRGIVKMTFTRLNNKDHA